MEATEALTLDVRLPPSRGAAAEGSGALLARVVYGGSELPLPVLGDGEGVEAWTAAGPVVRGCRGSVELASDGHVLFGRVSRKDADSPALELAAHQAFREILGAATGEGYPELLRVWACVPRINLEEISAGGERMERYKAFCRARAASFEEAWGGGFARRLPASTAVGSEAGPLAVHFLAAREPGVHVENPRQVAAYLYPPCYGPRSPSFARATVAPDALGGSLFVSGTASIVGHRSLHADSLAEQTRETMRNLERVREAAEAARRAGGSDARFAWSLFKVYLRRAEDEPEARRLLAELTGGRVPTLLLRADVCRRELLIEIEAVATPVRPGAVLFSPRSPYDPRPR